MDVFTLRDSIGEWKDGYDWYRRLAERYEALLVELLVARGVDLAGLPPTRWNCIHAGMLPEETPDAPPVSIRLEAGP